MKRDINILFLGTAAYAVPALTWLTTNGYSPRLVVTQPAKPAGRAHRLVQPILKQAALELGLEIVQPEILKSPDFRAGLLKQHWTVGLVAAYGRIIPPWLLALPRKGILNLHPSLLPLYRGASPIQAAIRNGDAVTGNTLMLLDAGLDTGPIIGQQEVTIDVAETTVTLIEKLANAAPPLLAEHLAAYLTGDRTPLPQPPGGSLTKPLMRADGKINWRDSATSIERQYRALQPWPGAWTTWNGQIIKLLAIRLVDQLSLPSGKIAVRNNQLVIGCGQGAISIQTLQRQGKKPTASADFINGYPEVIGDYLGM